MYVRWGTRDPSPPPPPPLSQGTKMLRRCHCRGLHLAPPMGRGVSPGLCLIFFLQGGGVCHQQVPTVPRDESFIHFKFLETNNYSKGQVPSPSYFADMRSCPFSNKCRC